MPFDFDYRKVLDLSKAHLRTYNLTGLNSDRELTIYYEGGLGSGAEAINWLQENRKTIQDVTIDHQKVESVWRSVDVKSEQSVSNKESVTVVQTFRYGFIESLTSGGAIDWTEARLVRGNEWHEGTVNGEFVSGDTEAYASANPQKYFLVEWHGINPEKAEEIRQALRDTPPSGVSPVINGESYGSGFFVLDAISEIEPRFDDTDKSCKITALIAKPRFNLQAWESYDTPAASKIYYLFDVPVLIAQSILNIYNQRDGATGSASAPDERGLVNLIIRDTPDEDSTNNALTETSCAYYVQTTYYYGLTAPANVPNNEMGITYRGRFDLVRQEGAYSGWIEKRVRQTQKVGPYRAVNTHGNYENVTRYAGAYIIGGDYYNVSLTASGSTVTSSQVAITLPDAIELGETWTIQKRENDDCTEDITIAERYEKEIDDITYDTSDSNQEHTEATERLNKESADIVLAAGANEVLRASVRYNKDTGLLDSTVATTTSKETEGEEIDENLFQSRTVDRLRNTPTEPVEPVFEVGKVKSVSKEETEFAGRFNTVASVTEAKGVLEASKSKMTMPFETREAVTNRNQAAPLPLPETQTIGRIDEVRNDKNEFGLYDVTESSRVAVLQTEADKTKRETKYVLDEGQTDRNQTTRIEEQVTFEDGKIIQTRSVENEYKLFDNTLNESSGKGLEDSATSKMVMPFEIRTSHTDRNQAAPIAEPTEQIAGRIDEVRNEVNEFGLYDSTESSRVATPQPEAEITKRETASVLEEGQTDRNQAERIEEQVSFEVGKIVQTRSVENEYALFDNTINEATAKLQTTTHASTSRADQTAARTITTNADAKEDATAVTGKIVQATSKENEFGKFDNTLEVVTPIDQEADSAEIRADRTSATETHTQADTEADDTAVAGVIIQTQNSPTEFGKFRTARTVVTPVAQTTTHISTTRADQRADRVVATNADEKQDATAVTGKIVQASSKENEFGKFDNTLETITPYDQTATGVESRADRTAATETHTQAAAEADGTAVEGKIVQTSNRPTEFGKYATSRTEITPIEQETEHISTSRADQVAVRTITTNADAKQDAIAEAGKIVTASSKENEFGRFDNQLEVVTPENQEGGSEEYRADQTTIAVTHTQNPIEEVAAAVYGKVVTATNRPTEFGLFATTKMEVEGLDQPSEEASETHISRTVVTKHTQNTIQETAVANAGQAIQTSNTPTEFGKYRTVKSVETSEPLAAIDYDTDALAKKVIEKTWNGAKVEIEPVRGDGEVVSLVQTPTRFKDKWDIAEATETGQPWDTGWIGIDNASGAKWVRSWGNQSEAFGLAIADELDPDQINSFGHAKNRFGLYDGSASKQNKAGGDDETFWFSTKTRTKTYIEEKDVGEKLYIRTVVETTKYSVSQNLKNAYDLRDTYEGDFPPDARKGTTTVSQVTSNGRSGYFASVSYIVPADDPDGIWDEVL